MKKLILVIALIMGNAALLAQCYETRQGYQTYHEYDAYGNHIRTYEVFETREVEVSCSRRTQVQQKTPEFQYQNTPYRPQPIRNTNLNVNFGITPNNRLWVNTLPNVNNGFGWNSGFVDYSNPVAAGVAAGGLNGGAGSYLWRNQWWNWPNVLLGPWRNQSFLIRL
jgi:hypothetical protein